MDTRDVYNIVMNFVLQEHVNLAELTTFKIGGTARYFTEVTDPGQLPEIFEWLKNEDLPYFILSGGSNTIFDDGEFSGLVIKINLKGFKIVKEDEDSATLWVAAGEDWDKTVERCVELGLSGIEALSLIPGLAGTAPVQNIGAYGQEIKSVIESVEAFDTKTMTNVELSNNQCGFSYRNSNFKSSQKGRYIITAITMLLSKKPPAMPDYPDVVEYFKKTDETQPTLKQIRDAVIDIRTNKLPDPAKIPNVGSFFKAAFVSKEKALELKQEFPEIKMAQMSDSNYKLHPGWLVEHCGLPYKRYEKPYTHKRVQIDRDHALVLENTGGASQKEVLELAQAIQQAVKAKFGIQLDPEPEIVKF